MHAACKASEKSEASEKFRHVIKVKLEFPPELFIFYKTENLNMWKGPGTVIGREHKQVNSKSKNNSKTQRDPY